MMQGDTQQQRWLSHTYFKPEDFTNEEADRRGALYVAVVEGGLNVCKICGRAESELREAYCNEPRR